MYLTFSLYSILWSIHHFIVLEKDSELKIFKKWSRAEVATNDLFTSGRGFRGISNEVHSREAHAMRALDSADVTMRSLCGYAG
jgi:hypothetical protein